LDDLIEKYDDEFNFSDIPDTLWKSVSYKGKIYAIPILLNAMFYFYRDDVFSEAGLTPAKTIDEYMRLSQKLTTSDRYGTSMTMKRGDPFRNDFHCWLYAHGGMWFDQNFRASFNDAKGRATLSYMNDLMKYAPPGVLSYDNDQSTAAMQQDKVAQMIMWATRAAPMDNPELSKVVGKVKWTKGPSQRAGGTPSGMLAVDAYAITSFTKNPDLVFQTLARATDAVTMKEGAQLFFPPRLKVSSDQELVEQNRHWPALVETIQAGVVQRPGFPEFEEVSNEIVTKRLAQALSGEMSIQQALDMAAEEAEEVLKEKGYY
jgi:ABC-type glycerol-3-phosphate transport system substrate-binding protein